MLHDATALQRAEQASAVLFGGEITGLTADEIADIFSEVPSGRVSIRQLQGDGLPAPDLLTQCQVASSKGEARRAIEAGGIYVNNHRVCEATATVRGEDVIGGCFIVLRRGRKNYWLVRVTE